MKANAVSLNGSSLCVEQVVQVARHGRKVAIDPAAFAQVEAARAVVFELMEGTTPIYGLNTGVGANKDNRITADQFRAFNERIVRSHAIALPPCASTDVVRATMLIRLNGLLNGVAGIQPAIVTMLAEFLNRGIHPRIPSRGSVGMADLGNLANLGIALIGEGEVEYRGEIVPTREALNQEGLSPIVLGPKDGLAIVSSNAFAVGWAALLFADLEALFDTADVTYALGYEAQNYNPMFLDKRANYKRPLKGQCASHIRIRGIMEGSGLWESGNQSLGGAISFKSSASIHGALRDHLDFLREYLPVYLNSSDDCPMVLLEDREMISTDNFIVTGLAVAYETMGIALAHLSRLTAHRILRFGSDAFTGLPRFLRPAPDVIGLATTQKTVSALDAEIRLLANPVSVDWLPTANDTEDHGCNTPLVMDKTAKAIDLMRYLLGIELIYGAQAVDLQQGRKETLGKGTRQAYDALREAVPFLQEDNRDLGADMQAAYEIIKSGRIRWQGGA